MPWKTTIRVLIALMALAFPAGASAAGDVLVFSQVTTPHPSGPDGEPTSGAPVGGLFAFQSGHSRQLTKNPADSEPSFSADGRTLVFVRKGDIWAMRADGSGLRQLTTGTDVDSRPLVAPNGRYILFERRAFRKRGRDLYTSDLRGRVVKPLAATAGKEHEAAFSPDGRQIAYVRRDEGGRDDIWAIRPSGADMHRLTRTSRIGDFGPHYLGETIVFNRGNKRRSSKSRVAIYSMDRRGKHVRRQATGPRSAYIEDVNAHTRSILFASVRGLWVKRPGDRSRKIVSFPKRESTTGVFSPDGRRIAARNWELWGDSLWALDIATGRRVAVASVLNLEGGASSGSLGPIVAWQPMPRR